MLTNPNYPKVDPGLHKAAKLVFKFPKPGGSGSWSRECPFFENPIVKESRSANLVKYNPIGRAGTLVGYSGAKSRSFSLTFSLTLPHLLFLSQGFPENKTPSDLTKAQQKDMFFVGGGEASVYANRNKEYGFESFATLFLDGMGTEEAKKIADTFANNTAFPGIDGLPIVDAATKPDIMQRGKKYRDALMMVTYWTNLIRSSVLTYAPNPSLGPPIIYFTFGILYQEIPTVAEKYSITADETAGYDVVTLLPNKINFSLTLEEVRTNAGTAFEDGTKLDPNKLRGWEALLGRQRDDASAKDDRPIFGGSI
jgi:hypothetical protein